MARPKLLHVHHAWQQHAAQAAPTAAAAPPYHPTTLPTMMSVLTSVCAWPASEMRGSRAMSSRLIASPLLTCGADPRASQQARYKPASQPSPTLRRSSNLPCGHGRVQVPAVGAGCTCALRVNNNKCSVSPVLVVG